jgi:hypothetical protein
MAWCSVKAQGQLCLYLLLGIVGGNNEQRMTMAIKLAAWMIIKEKAVLYPRNSTLLMEWEGGCSCMGVEM